MDNWGLRSTWWVGQPDFNSSIAHLCCDDLHYIVPFIAVLLQLFIHQLQRLIPVLRIVEVYYKVPSRQQLLLQLGQVKADLRISTCHDDAGTFARLDNSLRAWWSNLVVHLQGRQSFGWRLCTAE